MKIQDDGGHHIGKVWKMAVHVKYCDLTILQNDGHPLPWIFLNSKFLMVKRPCISMPNFVVLPRKQSVNFCSNNNNKLKRKERKPWRRGLFSLDLNTVTESPLRTVCGSEFQTAGAEHQQVEGVLCKCHHHGWLSQRGSGQLQVVAVLSVLVVVERGGCGSS